MTQAQGWMLISVVDFIAANTSHGAIGLWGWSIAGGISTVVGVIAMVMEALA